MESVFGENSKLDWGKMEEWTPNHPPTFKLPRPALPNASTAKSRPRKKSSRRKRPLSPSAPLAQLKEPIIEPPIMVASLDVDIPPPEVLLPSQPVSSMFQSNNLMPVILDSFDSLIAPNIIHPPNISQSSLILRHFLHRKQFTHEVVALIQSSVAPVDTIDQVVDVIISACSKLNIVLT